MHFLKFLDSYFDNLAQHPDRADMLLLWTVSTFFIWFLMLRDRTVSIEGMKGTNKIWEAREQIIYYSMVGAVPGAFYLIYLTESFKLWGFALFALTQIYQIFGRFIFDWFLAFRSGAKEVPEHSETTVKTETEVKVETK